MLESQYLHYIVIENRRQEVSYELRRQVPDSHSPVRIIMKQTLITEKFVSTMNSYYGLMKHFATYNIRRKIAAMLLPEWWEYVYIEGHFEKFVLKNKYNHRKQLIKHIKKHGSKKYLTAWDC